MSLSAAVIDAMVASGCTPEQMAAVIKADLAERDAALEVKRAKDAERQRRHRASRDVTVTPSDSVTDPALSPAPNENNSNPHPHTHPDMSTPPARKDPFPKPDFADPQHWTDLKANRKAKRLPNTPTAYAKFMRDIEQWVGDEWPPGRVLEAIVARGWASAQYDPRDAANDRPISRQQRSSVPSNGIAAALDRRIGPSEPARPPGRQDTVDGGGNLALSAPAAAGLR